MCVRAMYIYCCSMGKDIPDAEIYYFDFQGGSYE